MDGKSWVLRAGEYLVGRAARYLPPSSREQRHQEWSAELPVILHDPAVRPAARRAARMLWFAADTLRGAAIARNTSTGRHALQDAAGKPAHTRMTREDLTALLAILALPVLLFVWGYLIYAVLSGVTLTSDVVFLAFVLTGFLASLAARRPVSLRYCAFAAGLVVVGTGQLLHDLAHRFGWGHPLLFLLIGYCGQAVLTMSLGLTMTFWIRAARARFRRARV